MRVRIHKFWHAPVATHHNYVLWALGVLAVLTLVGYAYRSHASAKLSTAQYLSEVKREQIKRDLHILQTLDVHTNEIARINRSRTKITSEMDAFTSGFVKRYGPKKGWARDVTIDYSKQITPALERLAILQKTFNANALAYNNLSSQVDWKHFSDRHTNNKLQQEYELW